MNNFDTNSPGYIYLLKASSWIGEIDDNIYKIGLSIHPFTRLEEIQKGLTPFIRLQIVFNLPVSNMKQVEDKLHSLFDDKRIKNEWFRLETYEVETVRNMTTQISDIVRPRVRKAMSGVKYNIPSKILMSENVEEPTTTELESIILSYINHSRRSLSQKLKGLLNQKVISSGHTYPSPEELWNTNPDFKVWIERKLDDLRKLDGMNVDRAVYNIRIYDGKYGWIKPVIKTIFYGDD